MSRYFTASFHYLIPSCERF